MLQIATGKLFTRPVGWENHLRGVLYTNARLTSKAAVETPAGRLLPVSSYSNHPSVLLYELIERMEETEQGPGVLVSSTVTPYIQDYSVVMSFALNCVCTPDIDLAKKLTTGHSDFNTMINPQKLVHQFFDRNIHCKEDDIAFAQEFVEKLIGLPRKIYRGVMRALRTYVNGMHRIPVDLDQAYTLLVVSVESLAQDFDRYESDWDSLDEHKRNKIDRALSGADERIVQRVREAILEFEHVALARRFREFAVAHTPHTYFRPPFKIDYAPLLAQSDLVEVLKAAYQSRSKYLHQLQRLPDAVTLELGYGETVIESRITHLTIQGLSRLMRSVIIEFVMRQPTVPQEPCNYHLERTNVFQMRSAPQYWIGHVAGDMAKTGRYRLEGFLEQLASSFLREPDAALTNLKPMLDVVWKGAPLKRHLMLPYLTLHVLFNEFILRDAATPLPPKIQKMMACALNEPSSEMLILHALTNQTVQWPATTHQDTLAAYFSNRSTKNGLRLPRLFEAAISLELAERFRCEGDMAACREILKGAVENHPGHTGLLEAEKNLHFDIPIKWTDVMLPSLEQSPQKGI